jgi:hypothetical protein
MLRAICCLQTCQAVDVWEKERRGFMAREQVSLEMKSQLV